MNEKEKLETLKENYENIEIPDELEFVIHQSFKEYKKENNKKPKIFQKSTAAAIIGFSVVVAGVNVNPTLAENLTNIPIIGSVINVFVFRNYTVNENGFQADIKVPNITGLENDELEKQLNDKFIKEGQMLYDDFTKRMNEIKQQEKEGHIALNTAYEIKTDNEDIFSILLLKEEIMASSASEYTAYNIDKKNKSVITLESLFKNDSYIEKISENIKQQMRQQMKDDKNISYFIDIEDDIPVDNFESIKRGQNFYINNEGKIVIVFDDYEVAPGYMGSPEFVIPTETLNDILLDRGIIK